MATTRAVVTDPQAPGAVMLGERELADDPTKVLVRLERFSLNRGELRFAKAWLRREMSQDGCA